MSESGAPVFSEQGRAVPCPLCGSDRHKVLYRREGAGPVAAVEAARVTTDTYDNYGTVARCRDCGFTFRSPRPDPTSIIEAYATMEDDAYLAEDHSRAMNAHLCLHRINRYKRKGR